MAEALIYMVYPIMFCLQACELDCCCTNDRPGCRGFYGWQGCCCTYWGRNVQTGTAIGALCSCEVEADVPLLTRCVVWTFCLPCALAGLLAKHQDPTRPASCQDFICGLCCCPIALCVVRQQRRAMHGIAEEPCHCNCDSCQLCPPQLSDPLSCLFCCPCMACQICRASHRWEWDPCTPIAPQQAYTGREPLTCRGTLPDWGVNIDNGYPIGTLLDCDQPCDASRCDACVIWTCCFPCALGRLVADGPKGHVGLFTVACCCWPCVVASAWLDLRTRQLRPSQRASVPHAPVECCLCVLCCPLALCQICRASRRSHWHPWNASESDGVYTLYRGAGVAVAPAAVVMGRVVGAPAMYMGPK